MWGDSDLVAVLIMSFLGNSIHRGQFRAVAVQDADLGQVRGINSAARVMREALVALEKAVSNEREGGICGSKVVHLPPCYRTNMPSWWW